jgi:uncharacterized protein
MLDGMEAVDPQLREALTAALRAEPAIRLALLFGSQARGTARPDSDVDLAVLADPGFDHLGLGLDLERLVGRPVDVIDLRHAEAFPLRQALLRDGVILTQRPGEGGWWLSQTITELELDRPGFERMSRAYLARLAGEAGS